MADPLSLAASIAGLISLADVIFRTTYKFVRAAKDAKDEIQSLLDEINNLSSVLRRLEALASDLEDEGQSFDPTLRNHYLNHCYKTFNKIESRVKKASESFKKSKLDGIVRQLKWPFSSSETKELLTELSRHKETISVALLADSMRKIQLSLSKSNEIDRKITALGEIARRIEINTMIAIDDRKQRILNHFMKANPQLALQTSIRLRHPMTGLWLTESPKFIRWLETPASKLWLTGIPGAGKTVLAGSVVQEALTRTYTSRKIGAAFFFCDYKDSKTWNTVNILGALASQLARQNDESYNILNAYYEILYPPKGLPKTADADELRAQISKMCETFDQTIIVVDGIDECDDLTDEVVDNLIQLADYSERLSMALLSRDHYNIRVRVEEEFEPIQIAAHTEDVELYVNAEIDKRIRTRQLQLSSADMKEEIRGALVGKADGMFRWVVCQLDYLCNCAHDQERREALSKLPPDLPKSYRRLLERVNNCSVGVQNMVQMCLHFMAVAEPKLTIVELRQAVSTLPIGGKLGKGNTVPEHEILNRCSSLIRKSTDGKYFEFAHFSVREFLEDENAICQNTGIEKYWIAQHTTNSLLTTQCLRFIQMENFDKWPSEEVAAIRQRDETYPFYRHAALLWIKLTKDGFSDSHILDLAKSLFQPSKRAYFMCWAIEILKKASRLKNQVRYSGLINGLLHLAVKYNAFDNFKTLVTAGFDPYTENEEGKFPIHLCERHGRLRLCKVLKHLGVSFMSQDYEGHNILHYWAQERPLDYQFINDLLELDTEEAVKGLQARSLYGHTPLAVVFESAGESPRSEHRDLDLNKLCLQILGFLRGYCRGKVMGTSLATEQSAYSLKETFTEFDSMIRTESTPVHKLKPWVSFDQVKLLIGIYPDALTSRVDGRLPLESYITNTLDNHVFPNNEIIMALIPNTLSDTGSSETQSLWNFVCCLPDNERVRKERYISSKEFETMITIVFELGAMRNHEQQFKESGLKPLLSNHHFSLMTTIRNAILQTTYWDDLQSSDEISLLFQHAIKNANVDMIRLLVTYGASPHHRVNGQTPFEMAFRARVAIDLCNTEEGTKILWNLLECCRIDEILKYSSETSNSSPLHTLATLEDATNIIWLTEALVEHGIDVNNAGPDFPATTPLVYHLQQSSFQVAEKLLELGADASWDAVLACIVSNNQAFLRKILNQQTNPSPTFGWPVPVTFNIQHLEQTAVVNNGNAFHLAAACNSVACLELLLEHASETDKASMSDEGLTPLHIAAYEGHVDVLKLLLQKGFDTMAENRFGLTLMHMAVLGGSIPTVECLLDYGAPQTLDASGRTPRRLAFELGSEEIYELLEGSTGRSYPRISSGQELTDFVEPLERLAMSFERAMEEEDYESMGQLIEKGCPVDVSLPSSQGLSAFLIAVEEGNLAMGEWLLRQGASALQVDNEGEVVESVIEMVAGRSSLNNLLPELFQKYLSEGGDLRFGNESPFHEAVANGNTKGLEILLEISDENTQCAASSQTFKDILNRLCLRDYFYENSWKAWIRTESVTALHIAASSGNKEAISLLLNRGADIDAADSTGRTPLIYSKDADTAQHLISLGATMAAVCRLFDEAHPVSFSRLPKEFSTVSHPPRFSAICEEMPVTPETLDNLSKLSFDLLSEDEAGRSMMHCFLGKEGLVDWVLDHEQDLSGTTPFPWHLEWSGLSELAFLTSSFERLQRELSIDLFRRILNLEPSRGWSPLCHAAALNRVDIVANCLKMGADIDFEGSCFGSAVMNASVCGSVDAVKLLVRNGASVMYMSKKGFISCFQVAGTDAVREWLLCGRFRDQMRIASEIESESLQEESPWAGYMEARVLLYGERARWPEESTLDYAKRLSKMKKSWQGKVVRLYVGETDSTSDTKSDTGSEGEVESDRV
ncbi:hypothetical protein FPRO06_11772 [Fusarium proliferatum]|nr:hypothetical protein FPRO06_11772 [Fusarium proliferatum]